MISRLITFGLLYLMTLSGQAQIMVNRNFDINPLQEKTDKDKRIFGNTFFGAEVGHGFFSAEEEQTWNIKYQGFIEFYRWNNKAVVGLHLAHELNSNPYNEIYFNPRGAIWNESLVYHHKLNNATLQLGANHRCRHNIDNADPPRQDISRYEYEPQSRVLVLTSLFAGYLSDPIELASDWQLRYFGRADAYLYTEDARRPRENQEGTWENMQASSFGGFSLEYTFADQWQCYSRNHLNYVLFADYPNQINYRAEAGVSVLGDASRTSLFVAYERFFDDVNRPFPMESNVLFIGLRATPSGFF